MTFRSLHKTKRLPVAIGSLISGVVLAGFLSSFIATPIGSNDYLHEHLISSDIQAAGSWVGNSFELPFQDRLKLSAIVTDIEQPNWAPTSDAAVTGQALLVAKAATCQSKAKACDFSFRLNREFSELHINKDLRVANVKETSLRVTFKSDPEAEAVALQEIANETRLFRFYQTQNGWVQKNSEVLGATLIDFKNREEKFISKFSTHYVGINYYPASASWKEFWIDFPVDEIRSDLAIISRMNANSVRIFINHDYFDNRDTQAVAQKKLGVFLDLCAEQNIQVLVTLFDLRPDYRLSNMSADVDHIDQVIASVSDHPAILGIDIKNQADLDFTTWGQGVVEGWLTVMARHIQIHYPDIPITVGWSNPASALRLNDVIDFVTYHEYEDVEGFSDRLNAVKTNAKGKPVIITELGSTIWNPVRSKQSAELKQASRLENQLRQSIAADGVFVWTLNDFEHVGRGVVGRRPWRKAQQRQFGLIRADGSARPSKSVLEAHAAYRSLQPSN